MLDYSRPVQPPRACSAHVLHMAVSGSKLLSADKPTVNRSSLLSAGQECCQWVKHAVVSGSNLLASAAQAPARRIAHEAAAGNTAHARVPTIEYVTPLAPAWHPHVRLLQACPCGLRASAAGEHVMCAASGGQDQHEGRPNPWRRRVCCIVTLVPCTPSTPTSTGVCGLCVCVCVSLCLCPTWR